MSSARPIIDVIIPAFNEEKSIGHVIADIPKEWVRQILVCNNGSTDATAEVAEAAGARVIDAPQKGYGNACLAGMAEIAQMSHPDIIVFLDGDYSDHPEELPLVVAPIIDQEVDLVIGSRAKGNLEKGSMQPQQIFGNWLATHLIKTFYKVEFSDLGPFRAVTYPALMKMKMEDKNFGWTVEMQVKAAKLGLKCAEVPVTYRRRIGVSKVSGTLSGTVRAGQKIIWTIFKHL
jgi:glycosyltransferase involved in cell wall biosynthesis